MRNDCFDEIRLLICELLLKCIIKIVPRRTIEGRKLIYYIKMYFESILVKGFDKYLEGKRYEF